MANNIYGSVVYIDSAMGAANIINTGSGTLKNMHVNAIAVAGAPSGGSITLTGVDGVYPIVYLDRFNPNIHFATPQYFSELRYTAVVGTAWIYLA